MVLLAPTSSSGLRHTIAQLMALDGSRANLNAIDVRGVRDFSYIFNAAFGAHTIDISKWDMSHATSTMAMFENSEVCVDLSEWDVSKIENMDYMFFGFQGSITGLENWNLQGLKSMEFMFYASSFCGDIFQWSIENDTLVEGMISPKRLSAFSEPNFYHWLSALENPSIIQPWPLEWQTHFNAFSSIILGLNVQDVAAATALHKCWLERSKPRFNLESIALQEGFIDVQ